jgi:NAD+ kinase
VRIGICARADVQSRVEIARRAISIWEKITGRTPELTPDLADELDYASGTPIGEMNKDAIVTVGGDGTLLWALQQAPEANLLGVNDGEFGYLTEIEPEDLEEGLERLADEDFFVETRSKLGVEMDGEDLGVCTNEVAVKTPKPSKILTFEIRAGERKLETIRADGIIVSTPTGSTSYAMSAGGPLVHPGLEAMLVVPLASFRTSVRPVVMPASTRLTVELQTEDKEGLLALDGQVEHEVAPGELFQVTRSSSKAHFVRFERHFYRRIRELF